ncbi:MAG: hypothetical protein U0326_01625 [Polyangiales bacterium]
MTGSSTSSATTTDGGCEGARDGFVTGGRVEGALPRIVRRAPLGGRERVASGAGVAIDRAGYEAGSRRIVGASSWPGPSGDPWTSVGTLRFGASSIATRSSPGAHVGARRGAR